MQKCKKYARLDSPPKDLAIQSKVSKIASQIQTQQKSIERY